MVGVHRAGSLITVCRLSVFAPVAFSSFYLLSFAGMGGSQVLKSFAVNVHVCMCACVHVCMCACVHVCMCAWYSAVGLSIVRDIFVYCSSNRV